MGAAATSHALLAVPAALIGVPLGFAAVAGIQGTVYPGPLQVALVVVDAAAVAGLLAAAPVRARRRSLIPALAVE